MDKIKAKKLEALIAGRAIAGYTIEQLINNGKSAAVFKACKDGKFYAFKIFDNDLIERFGHEIQQKRIDQEIDLKGHVINNLVKIFNGGKTKIDDEDHYYLVMEYIEGKNLKEYIQEKTYTDGFIIKVLETLIRVTEELINIKIAHRDIKPENIMVNEDDEIILMDLGVLKYIGAASFSDVDEKQFLGTLRYAAPEFLTRTEEDSENGWRAVNLYQIGATLHDLIMKKEIYFDKTPYTNLVIAIKEDIPPISNAKVKYDLIQLTRNLLIKDLEKRLEICSIGNVNDVIRKVSSTEENTGGEKDRYKEEILHRSSKHAAKFEEIQNIQRSLVEKGEIKRELADKLRGEIETVLGIIRSERFYEKLISYQEFRFERDSGTDFKGKEVRNKLYRINGSLKMGYPRRPFYLLTRTINDENNFALISIVGIFPAIMHKFDLNNPLSLIKQIMMEKQFHNKINFFEVFCGAVEFDEPFRQNLMTKIMKILNQSLKEVDDIVTEELANEEKAIKSGASVNRTVSTTAQMHTIMIYKDN